MGIGDIGRGEGHIGDRGHRDGRGIVGIGDKGGERGSWG